MHGNRNLLSLVDMKQDCEITNKLKFLLGSFGGEASKVTEAYLINNPSLIRMFEAGRKTITQKLTESQEIFRKNDWKDASDSNQKLSFIKHLSKTVLETRKELNDGSEVVLFLFLFLFLS